MCTAKSERDREEKISTGEEEKKCVKQRARETGRVGLDYNHTTIWSSAIFFFFFFFFSFPFLSFPFLSFPFLSFPFLPFPFLSFLLVLVLLCGYLNLFI